MVIAVVLLVAAVLFVLRAAKRRKATLAGLNAARPVFMSEPPTRRLSKPERF